MKVFKFFLVLFFLIYVSCKSQKETITQNQLDIFNKAVMAKHFSIESNWAYPSSSIAMQNVLNSGLLQPGSSSGSISLIGNSNFLKIFGDSISSYLPYFGERRMQVGYGGTDSAIEFKGMIKNYEVKQKKDTSYTISFEAISNSENFNIFIQLFPNNKSTMVINSPSRNSISYSGKFSAAKNND